MLSLGLEVSGVHCLDHEHYAFCPYATVQQLINNICLLTINVSRQSPDGVFITKLMETVHGILYMVEKLFLGVSFHIVYNELVHENMKKYSFVPTEFRKKYQHFFQTEMEV